MRPFLITIQAGLLTMVAVMGAYGGADANKPACPLSTTVVTSECQSR